MNRTDEDRATAMLAERLRDADIALALDRVRQHAIAERSARRSKEAAIASALALGATDHDVAFVAGSA